MAYGRLFVNVSVNIKDMATRVWHKIPLCTDQKIIFFKRLLAGGVHRSKKWITMLSSN